MPRNSAIHAPNVHLLTRSAWAEIALHAPLEARDVHVHGLATDRAGALGIAMDWIDTESKHVCAAVFRLDVTGALTSIDTHTTDLIRADLFRTPAGQLWGAARGQVLGTAREILFPFDEGPTYIRGRPLTADSIAIVGVCEDRLIRFLTNRSHRRAARLLISPLVHGERARTIDLPRHPYPTDCALDSSNVIVVVSRMLHDAEVRRYDIEGALQSITSVPIGGPRAPITPSAMRILDVDAEDRVRFVAAQGDALGVLSCAPRERPSFIELLRLADPTSIVHSIDKPERAPNGGFSVLFHFGNEGGRSLGNGWFSWSNELLTKSLVSDGEAARGYRDSRADQLPGLAEGFVLRLAEVREDGLQDFVLTSERRDSQVLLMRVTTTP